MSEDDFCCGHDDTGSGDEDDEDDSRLKFSTTFTSHMSLARNLVSVLSFHVHNLAPLQGRYLDHVNTQYRLIIIVIILIIIIII